MYVIGGIVDRTVKKALTFNTAKEHGITCQRLPIQEYIHQRAGSHVLNVDHVLDIIHRHNETKDWLSTLTAVVPQRKQVGKQGYKAKKEQELMQSVTATDELASTEQEAVGKTEQEIMESTELTGVV